MRAAVLLLVVLSVGVVMGDADAAVNLDEIEKIDSSVFNTESVPQTLASGSIERAAAALVAEQHADLDADTESVAALAAQSAATAGEDRTLYSFRAMKHASAVAGSTITEKSEETHAAAMRTLNGAVSAEEMFAEISREQQILVAKRALVARQKQSIDESVESLKRLTQLIDQNKNILLKNERALRRGSDDLLRLISKYQYKLKAGLTKELGAVGGTSGNHEGAPLKSRPHQRAALLRVDRNTGAEHDSTKSEMAQGIKTVHAVAPKVAAAKAAAAKAAAEAASKPKFVQIQNEADTETESEVKSASEQALAAATESETETETEAQAQEEEAAVAEIEAIESSAVDAETGAKASEESESEDESESESEEEEESEDESEEEEESDSEAEDESEEDESSFVEGSMYRGSALPGLAPPPHLYHPEDDSFA